MSADYTVKPGDSLSKIAAAHHVTLTELLAVNKQFCPPRNPNIIYANETITIPGTAQSCTKNAGQAKETCQYAEPLATVELFAASLPIANAAYKMIGTSTADIPLTENGALGCAAAVSMMFKEATGENILPGRQLVLGTGELYNGLAKDPRFVKVPLEDALPGDIVVTARGSQAGHTGIVVNNNEIISNSSYGFKGADPGTIQNNYTITSWKKTVSPRNPGKTSAFRYIGSSKT